MLLKALNRIALSDEVAKLTGYKEQYIPTYIKRGKVPKPLTKIGRYHVWDREELLKWAKENCKENCVEE